MFRYEIHLHSKGCSRCGVSCSEEMVGAAHLSGYAGVVFTNHFYRGNTCVDRSLSWSEFVGVYEKDYLAAKAVGDRLGVDVLFGIEENYYDGHEALIYGLSAAEIASEPRFAVMELPELSDFVRSRGGVIICAHPFRDRGYIPDPDIKPDMRYFDGIEVYNQFDSRERDVLAAKFAKRHRTAVTSGGDVHNSISFGKSGLAFPERVRDNAALVKMLKARNYKLIIEGEEYTEKEAVDVVAKMRE